MFVHSHYIKEPVPVDYSRDCSIDLPAWKFEIVINHKLEIFTPAQKEAIYSIFNSDNKEAAKKVDYCTWYLFCAQRAFRLIDEGNLEGINKFLIEMRMHPVTADFVNY